MPCLVGTAVPRDKEHGSFRDEWVVQMGYSVAGLFDELESGLELDGDALVVNGGTRMTRRNGLCEKGIKTISRHKIIVSTLFLGAQRGQDHQASLTGPSFRSEISRTSHPSFSDIVVGS